MRKGSTGQPPDPESLDDLWRRERRWVAAILLARRPPGADLDDLLQEVALALVRGGPAPGDSRRTRAWLRRVAINAAREAARRLAARNRHLPPAETSAEELPAPAVDPGRGPAERGPTVERALELVQLLPEHYREPLLLKLRGISQRRIAEILEISEATVETRLVRARRRLRTWAREGCPEQESGHER